MPSLSPLRSTNSTVTGVTTAVRKEVIDQGTTSPFRSVVAAIWRYLSELITDPEECHRVTVFLFVSTNFSFAQSGQATLSDLEDLVTEGSSRLPSRLEDVSIVDFECRALIYEFKGGSFVKESSLHAQTHIKGAGLAVLIGTQ